MAIAILLLITGMVINVIMLAQPRRMLPQFTEICTGCGFQTPPMEYPPPVYACPICQWMEQRLTDRIP
jgi:hypothetical protein